MLFSILLASINSFLVHPAKLLALIIQKLLFKKYEQLVGLSGADVTSEIGLTVVLFPIKLQLIFPFA